MFNLFKPKKKKSKLYLELMDALSSNTSSLHINIYIEDQILFQIVPAANYIKRDLKLKVNHTMVEHHFFNKNKTLTIKYEANAIKLLDQKIFSFYEEPKGIRNYYRAIENNPQTIETTINDRVQNLYKGIKNDLLRIEYASY